MTFGTVCVFCAANPGSAPVYRERAFAFGKLLGERGHRVVFGGGRTGLMGALAEGALSAGGNVVGVMPRHLVEREVAHTGLTELHVVDSMHERKTLLSGMADAFVAMPGGIGTLEELFETWTWGQLGLHRKPYGLLNVNGFFDPMLTFLDHAVIEGFIGSASRTMLAVSDDAESLLAQMASMEAPTVRTWIESPSQT